jgi:hypothetical protein
MPDRTPLGEMIDVMPVETQALLEDIHGPHWPLLTVNDVVTDLSPSEAETLRNIAITKQLADADAQIQEFDEGGESGEG